MSTKPRYISQAKEGGFVDYWHCQRSPNASLAYKLDLIDQISELYVMDMHHRSMITRGWLNPEPLSLAGPPTLGSAVYNVNRGWSNPKPVAGPPVLGSAVETPLVWSYRNAFHLACRLHRVESDLRKELSELTDEMPLNHDKMYLCKFCLNATAVFMAHPCRHVMSCERCHLLPRVKRMDKCAICRSHVDSVMQIYP